MRRDWLVLSHYERTRRCGGRGKEGLEGEMGVKGEGADGGSLGHPAALRRRRGRWWVKKCCIKSGNRSLRVRLAVR